MELDEKDLDFLEEAGKQLGLNIPDLSLIAMSSILFSDESVVRELWEVAGDEMGKATADLALPFTVLLAQVGANPSAAREFGSFRDLVLMYGIAVGLEVGKLNDYN